MYKIKMLKNKNVCLDGIHTTLFLDGNVYTVTEEILKNMIFDGACEIVEEKELVIEENKAIENLENKDGKSARKSKKS